MHPLPWLRLQLACLVLSVDGLSNRIHTGLTASHNLRDVLQLALQIVVGCV